jgi:hypothetical protein
MTLEQRIYHADRAREVLENEAFIAAFDAIDTEITEQWKKSPARDEAGRHELWLMQSLLNKVKSVLQETLMDGKLAKADLQHYQSKEQKEREWADSKRQDWGGTAWRN